MFFTALNTQPIGSRILQFYNENWDTLRNLNTIDNNNYVNPDQAEIDVRTKSVTDKFYADQANYLAGQAAIGANINKQLADIQAWLRPYSVALAIQGGGTNNVEYMLIGGELGGDKINYKFSYLPSMSEVQNVVLAWKKGNNQSNTPAPIRPNSINPTVSNPVNQVAATSGYTESVQRFTTIVNPASGVYTIANMNGAPTVQSQNRVSYAPTVETKLDEYMKYGLFALLGIGALYMFKKGS